MGEAKRRKKLDPNYGKKPDGSSRFSITASQLTANWLIMIDGNFCYESAINKSDAEKVIDQLIEYEKTHPLPPTYRHITDQQYIDWTLKSAPFIDDVAKIGFFGPRNDLLNNDFTNAQRVILDPSLD